MFYLEPIERRIREQAQIENDTRIFELSDDELHRIVKDIARDFLIMQERNAKNGQ